MKPNIVGSFDVKSTTPDGQMEFVEVEDGKIAFTDVSFLKVGDVIQNLGTGDGYIVVYTDGRHVTASRSLAVRNASEWHLVARANK